MQINVKCKNYILVGFFSHILGESFKYQEFIESGFQYSHNRLSEVLHDKIVLSASDGRHDTKMIINITVLHVDKSAPILLPTAVCRIYVKEGNYEQVLIN